MQVIFLVILFIVLNIVDIILTSKALSAGWVELNPIMAKIMWLFKGGWYIIKMILAFIGVACTYILFKIDMHTVSLIFIACADVLYSWVVWNNYNQLKK